MYGWTPAISSCSESLSSSCPSTHWLAVSNRHQWYCILFWRVYSQYCGIQRCVLLSKICADPLVQVFGAQRGVQQDCCMDMVQSRSMINQACKSKCSLVLAFLELETVRPRFHRTCWTRSIEHSRRVHPSLCRVVGIAQIPSQNVIKNAKNT